MAESVINGIRIKHRRDTSANWTTNNPVILAGEIIIVDTGNGIRVKIGDGVKTYTQLPFLDEALYNALGNKSPTDHTHTISDILDLQSALDDKAPGNVLDSLTSSQIVTALGYTPLKMSDISTSNVFATATVS